MKFLPNRSERFRALLLAALALLTLALAEAQVKQPIEYPHNNHVALGLECLDCHSRADIADAATIPSVAKCMLCHEKFANESPEVQKLAAYWEAKREPPWVRVYKFKHTGNVTFRHSSHIRAEIDCITCHGNIPEMITAQPVVEHNMGTCLNCHRENGASDDCVICHN